MSPFSRLLAEMRRSRGLRQSKLAELIGFEQGYISALEGGIKGPPSKDFMIRVKRALNLNVDEQEKLELASLKSIRKYVVPIDAPEQYYEFCYELNKSKMLMQPNQIEIMLNILQLLNEANSSSKSKSNIVEVK